MCSVLSRENLENIITGPRPIFKEAIIVTMTQQLWRNHKEHSIEDWDQPTVLYNIQFCMYDWNVAAI